MEKKDNQHDSLGLASVCFALSKLINSFIVQCTSALLPVVQAAGTPFKLIKCSGPRAAVGILNIPPGPGSEGRSYLVHVTLYGNYCTHAHQPSLLVDRFYPSRCLCLWFWVLVVAIFRGSFQDGYPHASLRY